MKLINIYSISRDEVLEFLFVMLRERDPAVNISHREMPTFQEHAAFVGSMPYAAWYIIAGDDGVWVGNCYLSRQNEIGMFLNSRGRGQGIGREAVREIMKRHGPQRYLANIAPGNIGSQVFFEGLGFKLIQHTYEMET